MYINKATLPFNKLRIGVLALQGDFREHIHMLRQLGVDGQEVRLPQHLEGLDGIILPGGESTTIGKLMVSFQLQQPLLDFIHSGKPVWGTCAGLILLAQRTDNGLAGQPLLATMNIKVCRNAFGAQRESFESGISIPALGDQPFKAVFIRGPSVLETGPGVEVLAKLEDGKIVAVREKQYLGTAFHPEITDDTRFHEYFSTMVARQKGGIEEYSYSG